MIDRIDDNIPMNELPTWLQELWELKPYIARRAEKHYLELLGQVKNNDLLHSVSNSDLLDFEENDSVFKIAVATHYPVKDIVDFMALTGIKLKETEILLNRFSEFGISNIKDVNTLAKLGYFHYC